MSRLRSRIEALEEAANPTPATSNNACAGLAAYMREQQSRLRDGRPLLPLYVAPRAYREAIQRMRQRSERRAGLDLV